MSQERRRSQRFPTQQAVFITLVNGGREAIGGTMENISYGGALLYFDSLLRPFHGSGFSG